MPDIHILDDSLINLIAAGEVVERPVSVVKELVENAIDAGATQITVAVENGGLSRISVTDNGCGMSEKNARLAFSKHATSKILSQDDFFRIQTLGFRGEALAAIASVAKVEMVTMEAGQIGGIRIRNHGGELFPTEETAAVKGTTVTVTDLFYNTPARLKFMKAAATEGAIVTAMTEQLALSHPEIAFTYTFNRVVRLRTPGSGVLLDAVEPVFNLENRSYMMPVDVTYENVRIHGLIGVPVYSRSNRNRQYFFVNGRAVRSKQLTATLEECYSTSMLVGRYPVCVLSVDVPYDGVDVNTHPGKIEVKFSDQLPVSEALYEALRTALRFDNGILELRSPSRIKSDTSVRISAVPYQPTEPSVRVHTEDGSKPPVVESKKITEMPVVKSEEKPVTYEKKTYDDWTISVPVQAEPKPPVPVAEPPKAVPKPIVREEVIPVKGEDIPLPVDSPAFRLVGEAFDSVLIVEQGEDLLFLDKHALHERMIFEQLRSRKPETQMLLTRCFCNIGEEAVARMEGHYELLEKFGIYAENVGQGIVAVREIPVQIGVDDIEGLLVRFAEQDKKSATFMDDFYDTIACKAAIKAGRETSRFEAERLVAAYFADRENLKYCPHGRPIAFSMTKKNLEKQFKRT